MVGELRAPGEVLEVVKDLLAGCIDDYGHGHGIHGAVTVMPARPLVPPARPHRRTPGPRGGIPGAPWGTPDTRLGYSPRRPRGIPSTTVGTQAALSSKYPDRPTMPCWHARSYVHRRNWGLLVGDRIHHPGSRPRLPQAAHRLSPPSGIRRILSTNREQLMESSIQGTMPGIGSFRCRHCGHTLTVNPPVSEVPLQQ